MKPGVGGKYELHLERFAHALFVVTDILDVRSEPALISIDKALLLVHR